MCGVAGFAGTGSWHHLLAMTAALVHRGPDGEGFYQDPEAPVFLGHRRLAILDIAGGVQPMWNEDSTVAIVFNGEIYNHLELRAELKVRGHRFRSDHSDTEVLVHGYEEWGSDLPRRLNGMFAFAIYDRTRRSLFLARDRFGEKPLYYAHSRGLFAFASELRSLSFHPGVDCALDIRALQKFFAYGYMPAPNTIFMGARKLPGGCHLTHDLSTGEIRIAQYWRFQLNGGRNADFAREAEFADELGALLRQAAERRLISDVPLGVFLSGGIDSSSILASVAQLRPPEEIKTYTIGFNESSFDESPFAERVAAKFGVDLHLQRLDLAAAQDLIPFVLCRLDEPLGDASIIPTYLLSRFTRSQVTVALSGDGGDELFAGYDPFAALRPAAWYESLVPWVVHRGMRKLADLLPLSGRNMSLDFRLRRTLAGLSYPRCMWNPVWMAPVEPQLMAELFDTPLTADELYSEAITIWESDPALDVVDRTLMFYTNMYLPDDILTKVDRATMMNSLESRAVFLDNDIVEFCQKLPNGFKYRKGQRKYLLKRAMRGILPENILDRPKKGFGIPLANWLRRMPPNIAAATIPQINPGWVARQWADHRSGQADHRLFLWSWLSVQSVLDTYRPASGLAA